ncbi:asparagine synthase-related protein [Pirellulaceae bacterium]|nr:asparagine synthase-related protein [Pirellulaceae bacterium]
MQKQVLVERMVNLMKPESNFIFNMTTAEAMERVGSGDPQQVRQIDGQFALVHKRGTVVRLARSIGRPMRYFLAKQAAGPVLIIAERIDQIRDHLESEGLGDQFHPSYTRMVPAHYITELALIGCPDPNPVYTRYLESRRDELPADTKKIGAAYMTAVAHEIEKWVDSIDVREPIGVLFSGGIDSGAILLLTYDVLLRKGQSPSRLKAFTLTVDGQGTDIQHASDFLKSLDLDMLLETIEVDSSRLDYRSAVSAIEDYKPLDVQSATMAMAVCEGIRKRYPDWKYLLDGDGGDENLRDYPIEENSELTIRSVLNNPFFYHEGWGVDKIKHSLTYSGGQSRGHVRTYATAEHFGFSGFSPFATPNVISVAEGIPFIELTQWDHEKLYSLKGDVTRCGIETVTNLTMPLYEKNRFQKGVVSSTAFDKLFPDNDLPYREHFARHFA